MKKAVVRIRAAAFVFFAEGIREKAGRRGGDSVDAGSASFCTGAGIVENVRMSFPEK